MPLTRHFEIKASLSEIKQYAKPARSC